MTEQEKYYKTMNVVTAPVRFAVGIVETAILIVLGAALCIGFPIILWCRGEAVTSTSVVISLLTILFIFTFCYAPYYTIFGGVAYLLLFVFVVGSSEASAAAFFLLLPVFFAVGILQRYIRHRMFDPPKEPKPKRLSFVGQLNQIHDERLARQYNTMDKEVRAAMTNLYGDNYLTWPVLAEFGTSGNVSGQTQP